MFYTGLEELQNFISGNRANNCSLRNFIEAHQDLIVATNHYNSWEHLKEAWTKRFRECLKKADFSVRGEKQLLFVEDDTWKAIYQMTGFEANMLRMKLLFWCERKFKNEDDPEDEEEIKQQIMEVEGKEAKSLSESLLIMSFKFLSTFSTLTLVQKCVLKLCVSNIININSQIYAEEYRRHLSITQFEQLSALSAPVMIEQETEAEVKALFEQSKKIVFEGAAGSLDFDVEKGKKQQIAFICTYMKNKFREWAVYDSSSDDDDDEEDNGLKRKRKPELDESDIVQVLKEVLNIVFCDTLLRWRSGERTTEATKKARKDNESSKATSTTAIKNLMGRCSDLIAYNKKKIPVCLCEVKDGMTSSASIKQESKSIRCSESLKLYNLSIGGSNHIWSLDWSRDCGYVYYLTRHEDVDVVLPGRRLSLPLVAEEVDSLEATLVALYELKACLLQYSEGLTDSFSKVDYDTSVYHSPKRE